MANETRRNALTAIVVAPVAAAIAAVKRPDVVRQSELQRIVDVNNQLQVAVANIRRRLEAGAEFERGKWGVSTLGMESLSWFEEECGIGDRESFEECGLEIDTAERIRKLMADLKLSAGKQRHGMIVYA
jgi:hypothetical protein